MFFRKCFEERELPLHPDSRRKDLNAAPLYTVIPVHHFHLILNS